MAPDTVAVPLRVRVSLRRALGWAWVAAVIAVAAYWYVALRPQVLGGPAGYALIHGTSMNPLYHTGDIVIVHRQAHYHVGEIVAYIVPKGTAGAGAQVIHRLIGGNENNGFVVQGDNRTAPDVWQPTRKQIVGTAWLHIPKAGAAVLLLHTPLFLASLAAGIAVAWAIGHGPKRPDEA
jgi:signal peptidase I